MADERWFFDVTTNAVRDENRMSVAWLPEDCDEADGHLLAAAPAMLAALRMAEAQILAGNGQSLRNAIAEELRKAIDSAEGR